MSNIETNKMKTMSIVFALIIYGVLIGINFDPNITQVQAKVSGNSPLGIPVRTFFIIVNAILFFPIFFVSKHFAKIASYALEQGKSVRGFSLIIYLFSIGKKHPSNIRKSKNIVLFSLLYFVLAFIVWILVASSKGV